LPFIEVYGGLAQKLEYKENDQNNNPITKRMPVSYDVIDAAPCKGKEYPVIPDNSRRGLCYFEDGGVSYIERKRNMLRFRAMVTLVVWTNRAKWAGNTYAEVSAACMASVIDRVSNANPVNTEIFKTLVVTPGRVAPQDSAIFAKWTYDETVTQFLRPPFEFFSITFTCDFYISNDCISQLTKLDPICQ
jgi:hypothetical protein